jgi:dTDP-4-dehydrorhamnose reductase
MESHKAEIARRFGLAQGLLHVSNAGETSWYGFGCAIVEGLRARSIPLAVRHVVPIETTDYPTQAQRPLNSRLDLTRLNQQIGIQMPDWQDSLAEELAYLATGNPAPTG